MMRILAEAPKTDKRGINCCQLNRWEDHVQLFLRWVQALYASALSHTRATVQHFPRHCCCFMLHVLFGVFSAPRGLSPLCPQSLRVTERGMLLVFYSPLKITHSLTAMYGRTDSLLQPIASFHPWKLRPLPHSQRLLNWTSVTSSTLFTLLGHAWNWLAGGSSPWLPPLSRRSPGLQQGPVLLLEERTWQPGSLYGERLAMRK